MKNLVIKSRVSIIALAVCALALSNLTGCQKVPTPPHSDAKIDVTAQIEGVNIQEGIKNSRAIISDASWKTDNTFSMWVVPYINADKNNSKKGTLRTQDNYIDNVVYTYAAAAFTTSAPIYYPTNESMVDLYAISPSIVGAPSSTTAYQFEIKANQSADAGVDVTVSDIMTGLGSGAANANSGAAIIQFSHRMSKAVVKLKVPALYKEKTIKKVTSVEVCDVPLKSTINVTDTTIAPVIVGAQNPKTNVKMYAAIVPTDNAAPAGNYVYEAIVTPGTSIAAGSSIVRVTLEVEGVADPVVFDCTVQNIFTFEAKSESAITVSIEDQTAVTLDASNVSITKWGTTTDVAGSPIKLSRMIFDLESTNLCSGVANATTATIKIEGDPYTAKVSYSALADNKGQYILEFDHKSSFGGNLEDVTFKTATGVTIGHAHTGLSNYQIKGDPTLSTYSTVIATITFTGENTSTITKK